MKGHFYQYSLSSNSYSPFNVEENNNVKQKASSHSGQSATLQRRLPVQASRSPVPSRRQPAQASQPSNTNTISTSGTITNPGDFDVLCTKDKSVINHAGNQVFRAMIESWVSKYEASTSKSERMKITKQIVQDLKAQFDARFLRPTHALSDNSWVELADVTARDKVSHALRFASKQRGGTIAKLKKEANRKQEAAGEKQEVKKKSRKSVKPVAVAVAKQETSSVNSEKKRVTFSDEFDAEESATKSLPIAAAEQLINLSKSSLMDIVEETEPGRKLGNTVKDAIKVCQWTVEARTSMETTTPFEVFEQLVVPHATSVTPGTFDKTTPVVVCHVEGGENIGEIFGHSKITKSNRFATWTADKADIVFYPETGVLRAWWTMDKVSHWE